MNTGHRNSDNRPRSLHLAGRWVLAGALLLPALGCNSFGNAKLVQQLQNENERLLTEFRAERTRREEFQQANKTLEARLSESEKLLARQTQGSAPNRLSSLQPGPQKPLNSQPPLKTPSTTGSATDRGPGPGSDAAEFRWQRRVN